MSLYVRPQAWWTPIGLLAVIGPSRKLQCGPPAFWARRRANVRRSRQRASISCSAPMRSGLGLTGRNIGPRLIVWNLALAGRRRANPGRRTSGGPSILPAMQPPEEARPRPREQSAIVTAFLSLLFPGLGNAYARAWTRAIGFAALPLLLLALLLGIFLKTGAIGSAVLIVANLGLILAGNVVAFIYRALAAIDAYRVVAFVNAQAEGSGRLG